MPNKDGSSDGSRERRFINMGRGKVSADISFGFNRERIGAEGERFA
jgi:hypothetical protein